MQFEWEETKNQQNQQKHHISFENIMTISCDCLKELQNIPDEEIDASQS